MKYSFKILFFAFTTIICLCFNQSFAQQAEKYYLIKAGQLYDSEKNIFLKDQQVLVKGKTIVKVGPKLDAPAGTQVLDYGKSTVTPGLIDAHTHILTEETPTSTLAMDVMMNSSEKRVLRAVQFAKSYLNAGFTTIRDLGNSGYYLDVEVQKAIDQGYFSGPRMFVSGPIIGSVDGQLSGIPVKDFDRVSKDEYSMVSGADEAAKAVKEHIVRQVDVIKIMSIGNRLVLTPEELKAIVKTAHSERVSVTSHCDRDWAVHAAIEAGVDGIEHGYGFVDSTFRKMAAKGIYFVPTYNSLDVAIQYHKMQNLAYDENELRKGFEPMYARLRLARDLGVTIVAGSDAYFDLKEPRGTTAKRTIGGYFDAGLTPADVHRTATYNAAIALKMKGQIGVIKENAFADISIFSGDMQKDLKKSLFEVDMVMKDGEIQYKK